MAKAKKKADGEQVIESEEIAKEVVSEKKDEAVVGIVKDCYRLNVRKGPSYAEDIIGKIPLGTEIKVFKEESNSTWFKVRTKNDLVGYCARQFIGLK